MTRRFALADLPEVIPVFPLPGALLLPRARLPLNIFEPRYLAMLDDVLRSDHRLIGMVQPVNGGAIMHHARRPDYPVAAAQKCAIYSPLLAVAGGGRCTAWSFMQRFGWRLSKRD